MTDQQRNQQQRQFVQSTFEHHFGVAPTHLFSAPGRVNLIGEHTDYNDGFVLPCAINYQTVVAGRARNDGIVRVIAADYDNEEDTFSLNDVITHKDDAQWANYVRGVAVHLIKHGLTLTGADLVITGNVPQGAGLSSSASLEVAVGLALSHLSQDAASAISLQDIALVGQAAENYFVGCNCGIMDQLISALGEPGHALLIDCRSLETKPVSLNSDMAVMIINSNKQRGLVDSEYNSRREQCEAAADFFGVKALRDVSVETFEAQKHELNTVIAKRAKHVVTENARTLAAADAFARSDWKSLSTLMAESHQSMRDDFEITVPEIDLIVDIVSKVIGDEGGVRMTGGGFGGCVVALVPVAQIQSVTDAIVKQYDLTSGLVADIYVCSAENGAEVIVLKEDAL
ncbi:galactokinase [Enterovibrio baiacu]|uniref:galactokinase n=1 Tax=Enterovibrio baiacu TaxID=2491023 RepID=UPI003D0CD0E9